MGPEPGRQACDRQSEVGEAQLSADAAVLPGPGFSRRAAEACGCRDRQVDPNQGPTDRRNRPAPLREVRAIGWSFRSRKGIGSYRVSYYEGWETPLPGDHEGVPENPDWRRQQ